MLRGEHEVAETRVELPISQKWYEELAKGFRPDSKVWKRIQNTLEKLTYLQNYDALGAWSIELETWD
ncbi:MAG: hypothetical protein LBP79_02310 [Clostridiales bacterium]|jgi:hypothetical protein|nr:hypothetical protein [Clostridiales bacterium]